MAKIKIENFDQHVRIPLGSDADMNALGLSLNDSISLTLFGKISDLSAASGPDEQFDGSHFRPGSVTVLAKSVEVKGMENQFEILSREDDDEEVFLLPKVI